LPPSSSIVTVVLGIVLRSAGETVIACVTSPEMATVPVEAAAAAPWA
jgi:hypothetical protein